MVAGACLAETGNDDVCGDIDSEKITLLDSGHIPIYEPGLEALVERNLRSGRLRFTTDIPKAVRASAVIFIAVGTPPDEDGSADLQHVLEAARTIAIEAETDHPVHVCSNPEFLKEGAAVDDFMKPDRVVLGVDSEYAAEVMRDLYAPFVVSGNQILIMDIASAEITKCAANAMLATRISFMNGVAGLCERTGADIDMVRRGIGSDERIGRSITPASSSARRAVRQHDVALGDELVTQAAVARVEVDELVRDHLFCSFFTARVGIDNSSLALSPLGAWSDRDMLGGVYCGRA